VLGLSPTNSHGHSKQLAGTTTSTSGGHDNALTAKTAKELSSLSEQQTKPKQSLLEKLMTVVDIKAQIGKLASLLITVVQQFVTKILQIVLGLVLAIVLSFLIVLDYPRLRRKARALSRTRIRGLYQELAPGVSSFANVLGLAFQAQTLVAIVNTVLTLIGLYALKVPAPMFFSTIVFVCSFIPILGVWISSTPIVLICLLGPGGSVTWALEVVALITVIHLIEAYMLNPNIYGLRMKMHPLIVLFVLVLGGSLFGIWGFFLAMPITVFVTKHVIGYTPELEKQVAAMERAGNGGTGG
jgi:predicted PurR-regulated permease PerM